MEQWGVHERRECVREGVARKGGELEEGATEKHRQSARNKGWGRTKRHQQKWEKGKTRINKVYCSKRWKRE